MLPPPFFSKPRAPRVVTSFDDDDDFADFQSSTQDSLQKPMPLTPDSSYHSPSFQSPASATHAPMLGGPQPSGSSLFGQSLAAQKASATAFFRSVEAKRPPVSFDSFDDDFSAFASSSTPIESSQSTSFDTSGSSLLPSSGSGYDGFNSFTTSPGLRTPSPPKPPAKNLPPLVPTASPSPVSNVRSDFIAVKPKLSIAPPALPSHEGSRETRHQHTMSLMEMANSRKGKHWPAPPSPLPQALFPPPAAAGKNATSGSSFDLMADDDSFGSFNSTAAAPEGLLASNSSPAAFGQPLMPSSSTISLNGLRPIPGPGLMQSQPVSSAGSGQWLIGSQFGGSMGLNNESGSLQSAGAPPAAGKKGALSAQDLSFFEGL